MNKAQIQVLVDAQEDLTLKAIGQKILQNERIIPSLCRCISQLEKK
jgi:hypothetical protein